jgi:hypothetical protein
MLFGFSPETRAKILSNKNDSMQLFTPIPNIAALLYKSLVVTQKMAKYWVI